MFVTLCPECQSQFRVTDGQLKLAGGRVRCGHCLTVFEARSTTQSKPNPSIDTPPTTAINEIQHSFSKEPLVLNRQIYSPPSPFKSATYVLAFLLSCLGLAGQYLWFQRAELANDPNLRPIYRMVCEHLTCELNSKEGLALLTIENTLVREHPDFINAIQVSARVNNASAFYQPYPAFELSIKDIQGQLIARRTFDPAHYLIDDQSMNRLPPKRSIEFHLTLSAPQKPISSYQTQLSEASPLP